MKVLLNLCRVGQNVLTFKMDGQCKHVRDLGTRFKKTYQHSLLQEDILIASESSRRVNNSVESNGIEC